MIAITVAVMPDAYDENWASRGPSDDQAGHETVPAYIEMPDGTFKHIYDCSPDELRAEATSRLMQGQQLIDDARRLFQLADGEGHVDDS
jgi:hypothetical protein